MSKGYVNIDFHAIGDEILANLPTALEKGMEHIRSVVTPMVPVETGNLAGSGGITVTNSVAELYYPGPYALYQHEGVYYRHGVTGAPLTHTTGESFFLTRGVVMGTNRAFEIMRDELFK